MKKITLLILCLLALVMLGTAFAGTMLIKDGSKLQTPIQNLKGAAAVPAASRCDTVGATAAVTRNYTTAGYIGIRATSVNKNTGAPLVVKWLEDGKQVWVGSDYEATNEKGTKVTTLQAAAFANRTALFCVRRQ